MTSSPNAARDGQVQDHYIKGLFPALPQVGIDGLLSIVRSQSHGRRWSAVGHGLTDQLLIVHQQNPQPFFRHGDFFLYGFLFTVL